MGLSKRYNWRTAEPRVHTFWQEAGVNQFDAENHAPIYTIDTPPPTVSGHLHMGHTYSYSHADFMARFWRMNGHNVFYPMGFDDNGLPTERLVEGLLGLKAHQLGRQAFIEKCLEMGDELSGEYRQLWERMGLSIDWRYTYRTIDDQSRRISQFSFLELYRQGLAYRQQAPTIWCPECHTAIAQAEVDDLERESEFITVAFGLENGDTLPIATTRPELLAACVAIFVHPDDDRHHHLVGQEVTTPLFERKVPLLTDPGADPKKGTGAVMCCTFGDTADVAWWRTHDLPLRIIIDAQGHLTEAAGDFAGLSVPEARKRIIAALAEAGLVLERKAVTQTVRVHERCDTPVETLVTPQWYIRVLEFKEKLLEAGAQIEWRPAHMHNQYRIWVENLAWDWCVSRQRTFGVPIPVWYCDECDEVLLPDESQLPINPLEQAPPQRCACGSNSFSAETDVFDTWATSSLSPQILGQWLSNDTFYQQIFPMSMRPQAHEIIRTWAFYTIVKSLHHFDKVPWKTAFISGWGIAPQGAGKISKSRGGGPIAPIDAIDEYSADAIRYWAANTAPGKDAVISEEKMKAGSKLVTKLWNVARFSQRFMEDIPDSTAPQDRASLNGTQRSTTFSLADRWILARTDQLIERVTDVMQRYDYAAAKHEVEIFFWTEFADNYLEMVKMRLYHEESEYHAGGRTVLRHVLLTVLKLFAPFLPYITEAIYQGIFAVNEADSIHRASWPQAREAEDAETSLLAGKQLIAAATAARRYKSEHQLRLASELTRLYITSEDEGLAQALTGAIEDMKSITRAAEIVIAEPKGENVEVVLSNEAIKVGIQA